MFGGITDYKLWLRTCVQAGFIPDNIFTVGRSYVVATSPEGDLFIKRGPRGPREIARDPVLFSKRLRGESTRAYARHITSMKNTPKRVTWNPGAIMKLEEKLPITVS